MGMFTRLSDIVQANINAMLDKAEDPEKIIRLIIQEMQETMVELRSVAAKHLAEKKQVERQLDAVTARANEWGQKAELALSKDKEDLARAALIEKQACVAKAEELTKALTDIDSYLTGLQEDTARLNDKLTEAKAKQKAMVIRKESASARLKARQTKSGDQVANAMSKFESYEHRIEQLEAQVDAYDVVPTNSSAKSLEEEFKQMEAQESVDAELAALKKKLAA